MPGTVPDAQSANIRNLRSGAAVVVSIVAGGFDPVAVPAEAGNVLEITTVSGSVTLKSAFSVPVRRRPIVVRTDPLLQKRDVPLNASIMVVFSEPVDPSTLIPNTVQLRSGALPVAGTVGLVAGKPSTVRFTSAAALDPGTTYDLDVTQGVTDLTGDRLDAAVEVRFTTVSAGDGWNGSARVAFVSDRDGSDAIYVANSDGSGVTRLAAGNSPAWSLDGRRIAFVRGVAYGGPAAIYVMNADGSDLHFLANGSFPSWSPDGSQIVFNGPSGVKDGGIFVINADGSRSRKLIGYEFALPDDGYGDGWLGLPAWSPDGRSIGFVRANFDIPWMIYIMNADGTAPRLFNGATVGDSRFTWSPDGSKLLYQASAWMIVSAGANGAGLRSYTQTQGSYVGGPDWSPDARSILFERFTGAGDEISAVGSRMRIFVLGLGDGVVRQLIPEAISPARQNYWDHHAAWSRGK